MHVPNRAKYAAAGSNFRCSLATRARSSALVILSDRRRLHNMSFTRHRVGPAPAVMAESAEAVVRVAEGGPALRELLLEVREVLGHLEVDVAAAGEGPETANAVDG